MSKRKAVSKKTRFEVFKRDGFVCQYCGAHPPKAVLHLDHITPVSKGGKNDIDNLVTSCASCNLGKSDTPLTAIPEGLSQKAARIAEQEQQLKGYAEIMQAKRDRIEDDAWEVADVFLEHFSEDGIRKDWLSSIKQFNESLGAHAVLDAMDIAVSRRGYSKNPCFKYFCGICWNWIKEDA